VRQQPQLAAALVQIEKLHPLKRKQAKQACALQRRAAKIL